MFGVPGHSAPSGACYLVGALGYKYFAPTGAKKHLHILISNSRCFKLIATRRARRIITGRRLQACPVMMKKFR
jgi:hypothetical protein